MRRLVFLILLSASPSNLFSQESELFTPEKRKAFADYLLCEKDYLRASEEYEAVNNVNQNDSLAYNIALCNLKMNEFEKAKNCFFQLRNSSLGEESKLLYFKTSYLVNQNFDEIADSSASRFKKEELKTSFMRLKLAAQIKSGMTANELSSLSNNFDESDAKIVKGFAENFAHPKRKSPLAAALFSAMVPGAGKIYTKNYGDGITSFIVTGLFAFLSYDNFRAHHNTRGWIFAGTAAFFNAGNIYGSYVSARNYNLEREEELNNEFDSYLNSKNYFVPKEIEGNCK